MLYISHYNWILLCGKIFAIINLSPNDIVSLSAIIKIISDEIRTYIGERRVEREKCGRKEDQWQKYGIARTSG